MRTVVGIAVALTVLLVSADVGRSASRTGCLVRKLNAARFKQASKFRCQARAATTGVTADPVCLGKAEAKFSASYARADGGLSPCFVTGDTAAIEAKLDAFLTDAVTELRPSATASGCVARKLQAVGKKTGDKLRCHQVAVATAIVGSGVVDPVCLGRAEGRFSAGFARAETRPDCQTSGDAATLEAKVDAVVDDVVTELRPVPASACAGLKVRESRDKTKDKVNCHSKATSKGDAVDPACLAKAEDKFTTGFAKAESKGDCVTTSDSSAIEAKVDAFVADLVTELRPVATASTCAAGKFDATEEKMALKLQCLADVAVDGLPLEPTCFNKAESAFIAGFAAAEAVGDCLTTGDTAPIEAKVDAFVNDVSTELIPGLP